ncbi:MAG: sulfotransferase domain-containing protein [Phycisphaerales bacterium]
MPILDRLGLRPKAPVAVAAPEAARAHELFFVRGHPRSGTNWIGTLLNLHPQINCFGEFHFEDIRNAIDNLQSQVWQITSRDPVKAAMDQGFEELVRRCVLSLESRKPEAHWVGDRTPRGLRIFIQGAPYILIIRDGRDVLVSWTYHALRMRPHVIDAIVPADLRAGFEPLYRAFQADPEHFRKHPDQLLSQEGWIRMLATRWAGWMHADQQSIARVHAGEVGSRARLLVVSYERLHADVEAGRREMYDFLGLDPADAAPISTATKTTAGFEKEDPASFFRHGQVGDWKRHATDRFKQWFKESAGVSLISLGYEKDGNW